jgi:thiol-disulfide isomerase/thioredoxin
MTRLLTAFGLVTLLFSCDPNTPEFKTGTWRATLKLQNNLLPFNFEVAKDSTGDYNAFLRNAEERLLLDEVTVYGDSVNIALHIFDANIKAKITGDSLHGVFIKNPVKDYIVPFRAAFGQTFRFEPKENQREIPDFSGTYRVTFIHEEDTTPSVGIFRQVRDSITGTFLTPTGDYRYLQGNVVDGRMQVSTFDGNHAYLFYATKNADGQLSGEFFSGKTWREAWTGIKDDSASIPDPESLTFLKPGFEKIEFSFPDVNGDTVTLADEKYKNKVVILQLFGTWCPNCMDETRFLAPWYDQNKDRGIEIIGLAYERKPDFAYASARVKKMIDKMGVTYDFVVAGVDDKTKASETLPMLNSIAAFPTTIFIGKDGKVKKIHTGFAGPGTGIYYEQGIQRFNEIVNELLSENLASVRDVRK